MEWLRCEYSSNLFKTPKSVQCCQTGKLKSLIKLVLLKKLRNNLQSISYKPPPLPPLPPHSGAGEGEREGMELWHCANTCHYGYFLVALCQYIYLCPSGTVPMYIYTSIFLWHSANACLYESFLAALGHCML